MSILEKLGLKPGVCQIEAVNRVGDLVREGDSIESRLQRANDLIVSMGGKPETDSDVARIVAKYMIAQVCEGTPANQELARKKTAGLVEDAKTFYRDIDVFSSPTVLRTVTYKPKTGKRKGGQDKFTKIKEFVKNTKLTDRGEVLRHIEKELGFTYTNAYFSVRKAETELGIKFTAKKGKKKKAK